MFNEYTIAAIVPAFQEEKHLAGVLDTIHSAVDQIYVIDDGSTDKTSAIAHAHSDPRVKVITLEVNQGVGAAIVTGHRAAMANGSEINIIIAGDGQADPEYTPDLLEAVTSGGYGYAKANRFYSATSYDSMPFFRMVGSIGLTFLSKASSGYWNTVDPQNGYTAIRVDVLKRINLDNLAKRYDFENDMLNWLNILDIPIVDVDVPALYGDETSTMSLTKDGSRIFLRLFTGFWRRMWRKYILWSFSPVALFLIAGLLLTAVGLFFGILAWLMSTPTVPLSTATVLMSFGPLLMGFYLLIQAMMLDINATPSHPHTLGWHATSVKNIYPSATSSSREDDDTSFNSLNDSN